MRHLNQLADCYEKRSLWLINCTSFIIRASIAIVSMGLEMLQQRKFEKEMVLEDKKDQKKLVSEYSNGKISVK